MLAYTSLCRSILDYADVLWDPADKKTAEQLETFQNKAVRFIKGIKGRHGVTEGRLDLGLNLLADRRRAHRLALLMRILSEEDKHTALSSAYDEITNCRSETVMTTRAAQKGIPTSIFASSQLFHNSFLPRTIRDIRMSKN